MARINDLSPSHKDAAYEMRCLRLQLGMTMPTFGKLVAMDSRNIAARESMRVAWKESELQSVLTALQFHLAKSIDRLASLSKILSPKPTTKNNR
jgi:hypothetical protein